MAVLQIVYKQFPPSSNKLYFRGTSLTRIARSYAEDFSKFMAQNYLHAINDLRKESVYAVHFKFFFSTIVNETWNNPLVKKNKRAKDRYKRFDLDNRIKLLTDCVRDFIAVDDSHFLAMSQEKHQDAADPRIEIYIQELRPEDFGV